MNKGLAFSFFVSFFF